MDRRDLLKGAISAPLLGVVAGLATHSAVAQERSASALAYDELLQTLADIEESFKQPEWRLQTADDYAAARRMLLHTLIHALQTWLEADPARPFFVSFVDKHKKMLGDNPDARYHQAAISDQYSYRIFGNVANATYTSFTVELGVGSESPGLGPAMNDTEFETDADGNYEIILSRDKQPGNWLQLPVGASSIVTRHYYEWEESVQNNQLHCIPLGIENTVDAGPRARVNDEGVAEGIKRVTAFLKGNVQPMTNDRSPHWVSRIPNQFVPPKVDRSNEQIGYAAKDNTYAMAPFLLRPNQALIIRGRWPKCRFASVLLHDMFLQTFDYETRNISLNRKQTVLEADGSFKVVVAHRDPGMPNWLDTEGRMFGIMFWRFQLVEGDIEPLETELIELG